MVKYKVDKQGKLKIRDKKKIFKILRLIYDICSAIFILFVFVGLIISSSPRDDHNDSVNQHIPNIQEKVRRELVITNNYYVFDLEDMSNYNLFNDLYNFCVTNNYVTGRNGVSGVYTAIANCGIDYFNNNLTLTYIYSSINNGYAYIYFTNTSTSTFRNTTIIRWFGKPSDSTFKPQFTSATYGSNGITGQNYAVTSFKLTTNNNSLKAILNNYVETSYTQADIDDAYDNGFDEGYEQGEIHGMDIAADPSSEIYQTTYQTGYDDGYEEGYADAANNQAPVDSELIISSDYDFRGIITQDIDSATGLMRVSQSSGGLTEVTYLDLKGLSFKVDGVTYNEVRLAYMSLDALNKVYDSVNIRYVGMQDYFGNDYVYYRGLVGVYYRYVENGTITEQVSVFNGYSIEFSDYNGTSIKGFNFTSPKWSNGVFRTIIIVSDNGQKQTTPSFSDSFTTYELLKLNGSQLIHFDNNVFNVFSLLTQAFNSVGGILSIAIIPGISIGLLLFIPLIVTIILFIIHMIKK